MGQDGTNGMSDRGKVTPVPARRSNTRRGFLLALGAALVALPVAACGRKAAPNKPKESKFPREYPAQ
jgi:hypothetical protein